MSNNSPADEWLGQVLIGRGKVYASIVSALEEAIRSGNLVSGDRLPTHRDVAKRLAIDVNTVTRAYVLARDRGLVESIVGRGTFVSRRALETEPNTSYLGRNPPSPPQGVSVRTEMAQVIRALTERSDLNRLLTYQQGLGSPNERRAGAQWVAPLLGPIDPARVCVVSGAQMGLVGLLFAHFEPGELIVVEPFTYTGLLAMARRRGLEIVACEADTQGLNPEELEKICRQRAPRGLYCVPTFNPATTAITDADRRRQIARICQKYGVLIIEDDVYGRLPASPRAAVATWAPESTYYISTLSKSVSPALRHAFIIAPNAAAAEELAPPVRQLGIMSSPLTSALSTAWILQGAAERILEGVRAETVRRVALVNQLLPYALTQPECAHAWVELRNDSEARQAIAQSGPQILPILFAQEMSGATSARVSGMRISLGAPYSIGPVEKELRRLSQLIEPMRA